jgi:hypothetical protein
MAETAPYGPEAFGIYRRSSHHVHSILTIDFPTQMWAKSLLYVTFLTAALACPVAHCPTEHGAITERDAAKHGASKHRMKSTHAHKSTVTHPPVKPAPTSVHTSTQTSRAAATPSPASFAAELSIGVNSVIAKAKGHLATFPATSPQKQNVSIQSLDLPGVSAFVFTSSMAVDCDGVDVSSELSSIIKRN